MSVTNPLFPIVAVVIAFLTAHFLPKNFTPQMSPKRFNSIDGLRGYLAFFVYLHHSIVWYFYLQDEIWQAPPTRLFRHLGEASVAVFFMITSFLFLTKLLDSKDSRNSKNSKINWHKLYISRIMRLTPLYFFVLLIVCVLVVFLSNGILINSILEITEQILRWSTFTIMGNPDINGVKNTSLIIAGVTWSLPYEWFFYFSLPIFAFCLKLKVIFPYFLISLCSLIAFYFWGPELRHLLPFLGGIVAAFVIRKDNVATFLRKPVSSIIFLICMYGVFFLFSLNNSYIPVILLTVAFTIVAAGNSVYGVFTHLISRTLGELAYSIYLLHGILLFVTFRFIFGFEVVAQFTVYQYWSVIFLLVPVLIGVCYLTFNFIEKPGMNYAKKIDSI